MSTPGKIRFGRQAIAVWSFLVVAGAIVGSICFLQAQSDSGMTPVLRMSEPPNYYAPSIPSPYPLSCIWRDERTLLCARINAPSRYLWDTVTRKETPVQMPPQLGWIYPSAISPDGKWWVGRKDNPLMGTSGFTLADNDLQIIGQGRAERSWYAWMPNSRNFVSIGQEPKQRTFYELRDRLAPNATPRRLYHPVLKKSRLSPVAMGFASSGEAVAVNWEENPSAVSPGVYNILSGSAHLCFEFGQGGRNVPVPAPVIPLVRFKPSEKGPFAPETRYMVRLPGQATRAFIRLSPDGSRIAYIAEEPYSSPLDTLWTAIRQSLTGPSALPIIRQVFSRPPAPPKANYRIFVSHSDGTGLREITKKPIVAPSGSQPLLWLPDSRHIGFVRDNMLYKADTNPMVMEGAR